MNSIAQEMESFFGINDMLNCDDPVALDILMHYGIKRRSGRYPWGSGDNPYQHSGDFLSRVEELRNQDYTFTDKDGKTYTGDLAIAKSMGLTTSQLRVQLSLANAERRSIDVAQAKALREKGMSTNKIAEEMGIAESSVRSLLNANSEARMNQAQKTADFLREQVDTRGMIDVGTGSELELGVSKERMNQALYILQMEGYKVYGGGVPQATNPGKQTNLKVLCPPGTEHKEIFQYDKINSLKDYKSYDGGDTFKPAFQYPASLDSKRLQINYAENGGKEKDGLIELRRGAADLSLGDSNYAQVRIMVDGTHYLKGMAVYSDDLPKGIDVRFNTNKSVGTPMEKVLKPIKDDPSNPFGALVKERGGQSYYTDKDGTEKLSLINKTREEADWTEWANRVPSQFLSKQSLDLAQKQLNVAKADKADEFSEIMALENPTVKKRLLQSFADDCDTAAVHLYAAALPRQQYHVILPVTSMKDNEIYAPNYKNGETVALIRYPHGGTFEIPILKVNNRQEDAKKMIGTTSADAVGINAHVAERLSGADFDGDTVMVIPCNSATSRVRITSKPPLRELEGFDPKMEYAEKPGMTYMKYKRADGKEVDNTQLQMGMISNLITDMTLLGATESELARAVKHSMVVIDAAKHKLDYKQSEIDNGIAALKQKYQGSYDENGNYHEGAATLISRAKSQQSVTKRQGSPKIDPNTGELIWKDVDEPTYVNSKGQTIRRTQASTKMAETKDARSLISDLGSSMEEAYADYANTMKSFANQARLQIVNTKDIPYSPEAHTKYDSEVRSLDAKLKTALLNAPRERQAQTIANAVVAAKKESNPNMTKGEIKKASQQALVEARNSVGAHRQAIKLDEKEWEAIQAGAISKTQLEKIIANTDLDSLRAWATPRTKTTLSDAKVLRMKALYEAGNTTEEIAAALGVSSSTVSKYLHKKDGVA